MSFKQQLREWMGGLWIDFWRVPAGRFLCALAFVAWAVIEAVWRIGGATNWEWQKAYHTFMPLRLLLLLAICGVTQRQFRR